MEVSQMMTTQHFSANGKLLLTGEYFILDGAKALALPTKYGQTLTVEASSETGILWKGVDANHHTWFEAQFDAQLQIKKTTDIAVAERLQSILQLCPIGEQQLCFTTQLDFPNNWGLGSSSTLLSLIAQYFGIDPYRLLAQTFGGSGYDIACATAKGPITYQILGNERAIISVDFNPVFKEHLYFLHLGKKQNSREGIAHYKSVVADKKQYIDQLPILTDGIIQATTLHEFSVYIEQHEALLSDVLKISSVKSMYFSDFPGAIKSLGAWGGDFVLVASDAGMEAVHQYFKSKGLSVLISYDAMIL